MADYVLSFETQNKNDYVPMCTVKTILSKSKLNDPYDENVPENFGDGWFDIQFAVQGHDETVLIDFCCTTNMCTDRIHLLVRTDRMTDIEPVCVFVNDFGWDDDGNRIVDDARAFDGEVLSYFLDSMKTFFRGVERPNLSWILADIFGENLP